MIEYFLEKRGIFMDTNVNIGNELKENYTEERNKLINVYKAQAEKIALKYSGLGIDDEDLVQSAYEGSF